MFEFRCSGFFPTVRFFAALLSSDFGAALFVLACLAGVFLAGASDCSVVLPLGLEEGSNACSSNIE